MARADQRSELEIGSRGILAGQADIGLDDGDLALVDDQHRHGFDRDQERVERIGSVEQRIVLQAGAPAMVEKRLQILIVVVQPVVAEQDRLDQVAVARAALFRFVAIKSGPD